MSFKSGVKGRGVIEGDSYDQEESEQNEVKGERIDCTGKVMHI